MTDGAHGGGATTLRLAQATTGAEGGNDGPVASGDCAITAEAAAISVPVLANDGDPDGDALTVLSASQPASGSVDVGADGSVTFTPAEPGYQVFRYQVGDGSGASAGADVHTFVNPTDGRTRPVLDGLSEQQLAEIARACVTPTTRDGVELDGERVVVETVEPGQQYRIATQPGQLIRLADPGFEDASYIVVEGGLLVIADDGRMVYLADFVQSSGGGEPVQLAVAGAPPVEGAVLLASLQPLVVPAVGEELLGTVPPPDAGPPVAHGGGAGFLPYDPGALPPGFALFGLLPPTEIGFGAPPLIEGNIGDDLAGTLAADGGGGDGGDDGGGDDGGDGGGGDDGGDGDDIEGGIADPAITFQSEVALLQNSLGAYLIGEDGAISSPTILFPNLEQAERADELGGVRPGGGPVAAGDSVILSDLFAADQLEDGVEFGLFVISDGFNANGGDLSGDLAFVDDAGAPATIFDGAPPRLVRVANGEEIEGAIYHSVDPSPESPFENPLNPGGGAQSLAAFLAEEELGVVFEDRLFGVGDDDFNDAVFTIESADPEGPVLVFQSLTPDQADVVQSITDDPLGAEGVRQIEPMGSALAGPVANPTVTVDPEPAIAA